MRSAATKPSAPITTTTASATPMGAPAHALPLAQALPRVREAYQVVSAPAGSAGTTGDQAQTGWKLLPWPSPPVPALGDGARKDSRAPGWAILPACPLEALGDPAFLAAHGLRLPYIGGAMAHGISSVEMLVALGRAGMLGFFGAAGLPLTEVEQALDALAQEQVKGEGAFPFGMNLIHSPSEPALERGAVDLYLRRGVHLVSASAYLALTPEVVRYRLQGLHEGSSGEVVAPNSVIAKVSRVEVATAFLSPAPPEMVAALLRAGAITEEEARLSARIPVAEDLTAEADSGGHTDNRPLVTLLPTMIALRDRIQREQGYARPPRVGAAGGIATPAAAAAAFAMGAAYLVVGSVHQACRESGTSPLVRRLLAETRQADVTMAPAADMFELGVKLQVLKRGTLFAARAGRLYDLYRRFPGLTALPTADREDLEKKVFRMKLDEVWEKTRTFFAVRDPKVLERAAQDPKHQMALVFRWYLGSSSTWARQGRDDRRVDLQIWCGPAMGAFNEWTRGTFLEPPESRDVKTVALNLLHGAAQLTRLTALRIQGVRVPAEQIDLSPRPLDWIEENL